MLGLVALLAGCAGTTNPAPGEIHDPYEAANRRTHEMNKATDRMLLRPVGTEYSKLVPDEIESSVGHFSDNLGEPSTVLNSLLQGNLERAGRGTLRFVINSTVGFLGLFDVAGDFGLERDKTDFGETLHVWGVPEGNYVELPVLGPSTERDAWGTVVDFVIDPVGQVMPHKYRHVGKVAKVVDKVGQRGRYAGTVDSILYDSADSYSQARSLYLQNRRFELAGKDAAEQTAIDPTAIDTEGF